MTYAKDLQHFKPPTIENDLGRLNEKQIELGNKFTRFANSAYAYARAFGFPEDFVESVEIYNQLLKKHNAGPINLEDIYALDQGISGTVWDSNTFGKLDIPLAVMTKPRFELKDYRVASEENPRFTTSFSSPTFIRLSESSAFSNGIGLQLGVSIPFTEIVESKGALWSPEAIMMQELSAKFGIYKSRRGFLGTSCEGAYGDDGSDASNYGITGLFNYASNQTFEAGAGGDDNVTAQGDIEYTVRVAMTDLKKVYQPGKYIIVSTSGLASEMYIHRDTYQQVLDSKRVKEILSIVSEFQKNGSWGGWYVTEQLYASTPAAANQQMMIMKVGPGLIQHHLVYPTQLLPMADKEYEKNIKENMIFGDIIQVKNVDTTNNAVPISIAADVTASTTGFIPEGARIF